MIGALQRPRAGHHRARRRDAAGERADGLGRHCGDRRRPVGILRLAVALAQQIGRTRSKPVQYLARNAASCSPSATSVWASASSIAVSVLGRIGIHSGATERGPSSCTGLILTTSTPARASSASQPLVEWPPQPPFATCVFLGLAPPKSSISFPWRAIDDHDVSGPVTAWAVPSTCGRKPARYQSCNWRSGRRSRQRPP